MSSGERQKGDYFGNIDVYLSQLAVFIFLLLTPAWQISHVIWKDMDKGASTFLDHHCGTLCR